GRPASRGARHSWRYKTRTTGFKTPEIGETTDTPSPGTILIAVAAFVALFLIVSMIRSVPQATVAVVTIFGKYRRIMREGLNFKLPWEAIVDRVSLQNRALQMEFQAITQDQANVRFATMIVYGVSNDTEEMVKKAVFSFA